MMPPKLIPLAMIICDTVITDATTHKKSLIGMFNRINARKIPIAHPNMSIFLALTEGHGQYNCELRCLKSMDNTEIFKMGGQINFKDPNSVADLVFNLSSVSFPNYGEYRFEFYAEEQLVTSRKLFVLEAKGKK